MRSIYTRGPCGCSMPGIVKAMANAEFDKRGDLQLAKGRRKPVPTGVGRYVAGKHPPLARKLARVLRSQAKQVREEVTRAYGKALGKLAKATDDLTDAQKAALVQSIIDQLNDNDLGTDLTDELDGPMLDAFKRAASVGVTQVGFDAADASIVKQVDEAAVAFAADRAGELVKDLADTTLSDLRDVIRQGVEDGMSTDQLGSAIDDMGAFGEARADTIARTELANAHVQGNVEGWRATGQVEQKESLLGDLHDIDDVCDDCADAGQVDLDDDFVDGYDFPPYHPNCICDVKPIVAAADDEDSDESADD